MDGDAELDALLAQHPAARAAYERRIERLSPTRTWTDVVIRALATLVNSPMDEQQFAKALLEEFVIGATTQNIDAMNGLVRGMFTGVRRNCSTTMLEVDDATAVTLKSGAVPNSSARSLWTQLTSWRIAKPNLYSVLETQSRDPRFAPFVHQDAYGVWGLKPQPLPEIILKLVLGILVAPLKATLTVLGLALACNTCRVEKYLMPVLSISKEYRAAWTLYWGKIWIRLALFGLGFLSVSWIKLDHLDVRKQAETETEAPVIVSNHMGWSDILVHMSRSWPAFVAKEGIDKVPIVGYISQHIGCIYAMLAIKETSKSAAVQLKDRISAKAIDPTSSVRPMLVFPEGTTTNGRYLCKFKTGAFLAGAPVRPVVMHFLNQDYVSPSWESINIKRHIFIMMATLFHKVICYELPIYYPSDAEKQDPVLFAENVRQNMLSYCGNHGVPNLIPCDSTLENKLEYHKLSKATIAEHSGKFRKSIKKE
eukprot:gene10769-biopygen10885